MSITDKTKRKTKGRFIVAANAFIFNGDKILITRRSAERDHDPNLWECVSGRFNQNFDTVEKELLREIAEELGKDIQVAIISPISLYHFYRADRNTDEMVGINFICEYIQGDITLSHEHSEYKWILPEEMHQYNTDDKMITDINHVSKMKDIYFSNKAFFIENYKESN